MTPFTVDWTVSAEDELAVIWLQAVDRNAVTAAVAQVDKRLMQNPTAWGQHQAEGLFAISVPPLRVFYSIDTARRSVEVTGVWFVP